MWLINDLLEQYNSLGKKITYLSEDFAGFVYVLGFLGLFAK